MKIYSFIQMKQAILFLFFLLVLSQNMTAIDHNDMETVTRSEFVKMDASQKTILIHKWNNYSLPGEVPASVEQKALAYYKQNNIDERIYYKYKILLKTVTNELLPVSNRINACYFIIENYDPAIFPVEVVKDILDELILKSK